MCLLPYYIDPAPQGQAGCFPGYPKSCVGFLFSSPISTERLLPTFLWDFYFKSRFRVATSSNFCVGFPPSKQKARKNLASCSDARFFFSCLLSFLRHRGLSSEAAQQPYRSLFPHDVFLSGAAFTRFFFYSFRSRYSAASALPFRKDGISGYSAGSVSPSRSFHTAAPAAVTRSATVCTPRTSRSSGSAA